MFCGAVHICPVYSASEKATLRTRPLKSAAESTTIWLTPAFSVKTCACRALRFEPVAVGVAPGEVDQLDLGPQRERLRGVVAGGMGDERHHVRIEARFGQHLARDPHRDRERQDRGGMRLHHHRVAGGEIGEQAGIAVPRRERAAADHEPDAARHDPVALFHPQRLALALRLFPQRLLPECGAVRPTRTTTASSPRSCACGPPAWNAIMNAWPVVCITALAMRKLCWLIRCRISRQTPAHASGPARRQPASAVADRREQRVDVGLRVRDAERKAVRRALAADRADGARLVQRERLVAQRVEGGLAGFGGALAVDLRARRFGIRRSSSRARRWRRARGRAWRGGVRTGVRHGDSSNGGSALALTYPAAVEWGRQAVWS